MHPLTLETPRSRSAEASAASEIYFPAGLIGLPCRRYTLLDDGSGPIRRLQSSEDPGLSIPIASPFTFFENYTIRLSPAESARLPIPDLSQASTYVTVRRDESDGLVMNLRAPIIIFGGQGFQVINQAPDALLRAPTPT